VKFTYLLGALFFIVIWMAFFGLFPKGRTVIFWSSLSWGPAGPISEYWHRADYWRPELIFAVHIGNWTFGLEDFLFAFAFGGICTGIFDLLMRRIWQAEDIRFNLKGFIKLLSIVLLSLMLMGVLSWIFHLNSLPAISISFILLAGSIFYRGSRLLLPGLVTALLMMFFMWLFYWAFFLRLYPDIIGRWWISNALSGITLAKVPIEELIWAASAGLFIGPAARYSLITSQLT
jgi:Lycopene cyclase